MSLSTPFECCVMSTTPHSVIGQIMVPRWSHSLLSYEADIKITGWLNSYDVLSKHTIHWIQNPGYQYPTEITRLKHTVVTAKSRELVALSDLYSGALAEIGTGEKLLCGWFIMTKVDGVARGNTIHAVLDSLGSSGLISSLSSSTYITALTNRYPHMVSN